MSEEYTIERAVDLLNSIDPMTEARTWVIDGTLTLVILSDGTYALLNDKNHTYQVFDTAGQAFGAVDEPSLVQWVSDHD